MMEHRRKVKNQISQQEYRELCKNIQKECRQAKEGYYSRLCEKLEELDRLNSIKLHSEVKKFKDRKPQIQLGIKSKEGDLLHTDEDITRRWEEYIGDELFKDERGEMPDIQITDNHPSIDEQEVIDAINQLPNNKAPGVDNLPAELLKELGTSGTRQLTKLVNLIYKTGGCWKTSLWAVLSHYRK